jgi:tRNA-splicing endonuclease subunit Sen34
VLTGTLPHLSQQNVFLGLPLILMPEELVLLIEKREWSSSHTTHRVFLKYIASSHEELAMIVHDPAAHHTPAPSQLETWDASRRQDIAHQLARLEQRKAEDRASATATATPAATTTATPAQDATIQQKRAEREARRRQLATAAATADADADADAAGADSGAGIRGRKERDLPASNAVYTVSVPTTSDTFAWYAYKNNDEDKDPALTDGAQQQQQQRHTYETLDAARTAGVWSYPSNAEERARCEVFRDLWEKGYYMGGGSKFGGDWLVYPGAPYARNIYFLPHTRARADNRRSPALPFALRCHCANFPICPVAPDGSCGAWSTRYGNEKGASFVWLGPCEPRSHVHQHRVGRIRVAGDLRRILFVVWYLTVNDNGM